MLTDQEIWNAYFSREVVEYDTNVRWVEVVVTQIQPNVDKQGNAFMEYVKVIEYNNTRNEHKVSSYNRLRHKEKKL